MVSYKALNTVVKSTVSNCCDTIGDIYTGERVALRKSTVSNRCDTIWDIYADEMVAGCKSPIPNRCDTIWDIYAGEKVATAKSRIPNNFYSFPNWIFTTQAPWRTKQFLPIPTIYCTKLILYESITFFVCDLRTPHFFFLRFPNGSQIFRYKTVFHKFINY